jgi:hypothetical protein
MQIKTVSDFRKAYKSGPYVWPGGYPLYFVTADGAALSWAAAKECRSQIVRAVGSDDTRSGWRIIGADVNWEDASLYCDHTGERIPSAYAEDGA